MLRCSYSEARLDAYVDGELAPPERGRIAAHVAECPHCAGLLEEFRVIDALLLAPRRLEPAPNFTLKVMAEVRSLPPPHALGTSSFGVLATYVVFAWATIGAFLMWGGASARAMLATLGSGAQHYSHVFGNLTVVTGHLFGRQTTDVTAAMATVFAGDVVVAGAIIGAYALRRSRRAAAARTAGPC